MRFFLFFSFIRAIVLENNFNHIMRINFAPSNRKETSKLEISKNNIILHTKYFFFSWQNTSWTKVPIDKTTEATVLVGFGDSSVRGSVVDAELE
jgi:hypothetical protein